MVFFKRVVFAVLAVSVIFSTNEACVCRVLIFILNLISGAQLLWSVLISTTKILSYIYLFDYECSLPESDVLAWFSTRGVGGGA